MHLRHLLIPVMSPVLAVLGAVDQPVAATAGWQAVGWGGGAYYFATAWHPTDGNVLYLSSDCAGTYHSDDKGLHWSFANNGLCDYGAYCLAVGPAAPDMVYILTEGGLCKSIDRARTWEFIAASDAKRLDIRSDRGGSVRAVAIDPRNADIVYAGSRTGRLFKTVDGAKTWSELPYRDVLPPPPALPAFTGAGSLRVTYDGGIAGNDPMGRFSKFYGEGKAAKDWSAWKKLSARFRLPEDAPAVQAQLIVQSGDNWLWQQGAWIEGKPGAWVEIPLDLTTLKSLDSVRMVHIAIRTFQPGWKGEVLVDSVALHSEITGTLAAGQAADGKSAVLVADWEKTGDVEGWAANHQGKDFLKISGIRQSREKRSGDVLSSVAVAGDGAVYASNTKHGVFRSDDAGATWAALASPRKVMSVTVSPVDPKVVWAACAGDGVQRSADRGKTWTAMPLEADGKASVREIALAKSKPDRVYAIASIDWGGFLYISDDGGKTWLKNNQVRAGLPGNPTVPGDSPKGMVGLSTVTSIAVNPANPDELFISGNWRNIFSGDGGKTLEERSTGADNTCVTDIQFLGDKTYATAMDEGLLVTENDGKEWRQLLPLKYDADTSGHFWRVRAAKVGDGIQIVTVASPWKSFGDPKCVNRAYVSNDGGATFAISATGLPDYVPNINCMWGRSFPRALAQHPTDPGILYLGMDGDPEPAKKLPGGGIFRSADGGKSWTRCAGQPGGLRLYYGLVVDPGEPKRLWYSCCGAGGGVWRSDDEGATWSHVFKNEGWIFNLDVSPSGVVLVGGKDLWRSTDHGASWKKQTAFSGDETIVGIAIDPADEKRAWISRLTWDSSNRGGIWRTVDGGANWQEITGDIPFRKPQILRYNAEKHELWAAGVGVFKIRQ